MENNIETLYKWIDSYPITRQKRNINRDFSDAVPLAEILKKHYPRLVDLHNYSPQNSLSQKLVNWATLNRKVLSRLRMPLSTTAMEKLAKSTPGEIEKLLFEIKAKIETSLESGDQNSDVFSVEGLSPKLNDTNVIPIKVRSGSRIFQQKMVPAEKYDKMENELREKDAAIFTLQNRVNHLESMVNIKEERIQDLTKQIQSLINTPTNDGRGVSGRGFCCVDSTSDFQSIHDEE